MSTQIVTLQNESWTQVYTGPTSQAIAVEKKNRGASVWLAISASEPTFTANGHFLLDGHIKNVELNAGENLYAYAISFPAMLTLTD